MTISKIGNILDVLLLISWGPHQVVLRDPNQRGLISYQQRRFHDYYLPEV